MAKKKAPQKATRTVVSRHIRINWQTDAEILFADFFRIVYDNERAILAIAAIDPELRSADLEDPPDQITLKPLARFVLSPKALRVLKGHVDRAFEGMKEKGASFDERHGDTGD